MAMKFNERYRTDAKLENEGKWHEWGEGGRVLIARIGNTKYREMLRAEMSQFDALRRSGRKVPDEDATKVTVKCMAHTILLGWEHFSGEGLESLGIKLDAEKEIPYSPENAHILLTEFKDFREEVAVIATDMENFRAEQVESAVKN